MGRPRKNNDSALTQKDIDKIFGPSEVKTMEAEVKTMKVSKEEWEEIVAAQGYNREPQTIYPKLDGLTFDYNIIAQQTDPILSLTNRTGKYATLQINKAAFMLLHGKDHAFVGIDFTHRCFIIAPCYAGDTNSIELKGTRSKKYTIRIRKDIKTKMLESGFVRAVAEVKCGNLLFRW
jgi:hypothetical protein